MFHLAIIVFIVNFKKKIGENTAVESTSIFNAFGTMEADSIPSLVYSACRLANIVLSDRISECNDGMGLNESII